MPALHGKNSVRIKRQNETALKLLLYRSGPISRAEIAAQLELASPTITNITAEMIREGILHELPVRAESTSNVGRKPIQLDFVSDYRYALGISVGRDLSHYSIVDLRGTPTVEETWELMPDSYDGLLDSLSRLLAHVRENYSKYWKKLLGIGLVMPGHVDPNNGVPMNCGGERTDWMGKPLALDLTNLAGVPVVCENNVRARAYAVQLFRPDLLGEENAFAFCHLNWGIACPVFLVDDPSAQVSFAGEIGHMIMNPDGPTTRKYSTPGSLEVYSSVFSMLESCENAMRLGKTPILSSICSDPDHLKQEDLWTAQQLGDPIVCQVINRGMRYIGIALANVVNFMDPHLFFLSGAAFSNKDNVNTVRRSMEQYAFRAGDHELRLKTLSLGEYGGSWGAAAVCINRFFIHQNNAE